MPEPEQIGATHESHFERERMFRSFIDSLAMMRHYERRLSQGVLSSQLGGLALADIEKKELKDQDDVDQLISTRNNLRTLFFSHAPIAHKYGELVNRGVNGELERDPVRYAALEDPELAHEARELVRLGIIYNLSSKQVHAARVARHQRRVGQHGLDGLHSNDTEELIMFNHAIRELIERQGKKLGINREKARELIRTVLPGNREEIEAVEEGVALEIATKRLFDGLAIAPEVSEVVEYGDVDKDKVGGDIVLYPGTRSEVLVDVKSSAPDKIRPHISQDSIAQPGSYWDSNRKVFIWLGTDGFISNNYQVPAGYRDQVEQILQEAAPRSMVA